MMRWRHGVVDAENSPIVLPNARSASAFWAWAVVRSYVGKSSSFLFISFFWDAFYYSFIQLMILSIKAHHQETTNNPRSINSLIASTGLKSFTAAITRAARTSASSNWSGLL